MAHMTRFLRLIALSVAIQFGLHGADLAGIWMGETTGRNGEKQDIAFQFKTARGNAVGVMFGDEVDLPLEDLKIEEDKVSFSVTTVNYYSGSRQTMVYTGTVSDKEMRLTRERKGGAVGDRPMGKLEILLKRVTSRPTVSTSS